MQTLVAATGAGAWESHTTRSLVSKKPWLDSQALKLATAATRREVEDTGRVELRKASNCEWCVHASPSLVCLERLAGWWFSAGTATAHRLVEVCYYDAAPGFYICLAIAGTEHVLSN
jgi:hypothetical protein